MSTLNGSDGAVGGGRRGAPVLAIVGATGAVGREMLTVLEQREFPHAPLPRGVRLLASVRSAGQKIPYRGEMLTVEALTEGAFDGVDIALFSAGSGISRRFGPIAAAAGALVVDNSSAFRMDEGVPLVVPEINGEAMRGVVERWSRGWKNGEGETQAGSPCHGGGIIANPNCSTIIMLMALTPLHRAFGVDRVVAATYQAASGAGARGMEELLSQTREVLEGREPRPELFPEPYAFNLFSHNAEVDPRTGLNGEEQKMIQETGKIWGDASVRVSAMCIRVPVLRAHSQALNVTLRRPATTAQVREALAGFPGVRVVDDRAGNRFPTPLKASGGDDVLVGRVRPDPSQLPRGDGRGGDPDDMLTLGFDLFVCGDQLRKGAALNAVQIAEAALGMGGGVKMGKMAEGGVRV